MLSNCTLPADKLGIFNIDDSPMMNNTDSIDWEKNRLRSSCTIFQFCFYFDPTVNRVFGQRCCPECFLTPRAVECHWYATMLVKRFQCSYARTRAVGKILQNHPLVIFKTHPLVMAMAWGLPSGTHSSQMKNGEKWDFFLFFKSPICCCMRQSCMVPRCGGDLFGIFCDGGFDEIWTKQIGPQSKSQ